MSLLFPDLYLENVVQIDKSMLDNLGVTALILDIDNTLTTHNNPAIGQDVQNWLAGLISQGVGVVLLSNNRPQRVLSFAKQVNLPCCPNAMKPLSKGMKQARSLLGDPPIKQIAVVGDQIFTDVLGGNLYGATTIRVEPLQKEGGLFFRFKRMLENSVMKRYKKKRGAKVDG